MNNKHFLLLILLTPLFLNLKCKKEETPEGYFFMCKLDGKEYRASGGLCVNCITAFLLNDTSLLLSGKSSSEHIGIGINDGQKIREKTYSLSSIIQDGAWGGGTYDNSIAPNDRYDTDSLRTGQITITRLDKVKKEVEGTFYFKAYNPLQDKIVNITEGKFRISLK